MEFLLMMTDPPSKDSWEEVSIQDVDLKFHFYRTSMMAGLEQFSVQESGMSCPLSPLLDVHGDGSGLMQQTARTKVIRTSQRLA